MKFLIRAFLPVIGLVLTIGPALARPWRPAQIPNGTVISCSACHVNPGGGGVRNDFGKLVERSFLVGDDVNWNPLLASLDADGDGVANGVELQDRFGIWQIGQPNPGNPSSVTLPGNAASHSRRTLTIQFSGMDPHVGQYLGVRVIDKSTGMEAGRVSLASIPSASFSVAIPTVLDGRSYWVDMWADLSGNGLYDAPPADHAWRFSADVSGATTVNFAHNTDFTDVAWRYALTVNAQAMSPHLGQLFELRVVDTESGLEAGRTRVEILPGADFALTVPCLELGRSYDVDFYADLSNDGMYSGTPTDHAWRQTVTSTDGDVTLDFTHNTNFTDVMWEYLFQLNLLAMDPHVGQLFELRVVDPSGEDEIGRARFDEVSVANFTVSVPGISRDVNYQADFYADLNGSGDYNAPPVDHAWRQSFQSSAGNAVVNFTHNTNFTDIGWPSLAADDPFAPRALPDEFALEQNYPNPFNPTTSLIFDLAVSGRARLAVYNVLGEQVAVLAEGNFTAGRHELAFDGNGLASGVYIYRLETNGRVAEKKMVMMK